MVQWIERRKRMKKVIIFVFLALLLTGCSEFEYDGTIEPLAKSVDSVEREYSEFELAVDKVTNIVYIDNVVTWKDGDGWRRETHIYTPYYSKNGKLCKFDDERVVEIE